MNDDRLYKDLDDPYGKEEEAKQILAVPIIENESGEFNQPRGVILVINKNTGDYNNDDIDNLLDYGRLAFKISDNLSYIIY